MVEISRPPVPFSNSSNILILGILSFFDLSDLIGTGPPSRSRLFFIYLNYFEFLLNDLNDALAASLSLSGMENLSLK